MVNQEGKPKSLTKNCMTDLRSRGNEINKCLLNVLDINCRNDESMIIDLEVIMPYYYRVQSL